MNRLKFRGWHKTLNKMILFDEMSINTEHSQLTFSSSQPEYSGWHKLPSPSESLEEIDDYFLFLMTPTGLLDCNSKEIWEADIVNYLGINYVVSWSNDLTRLVLRPFMIGRHYDLNKKVAEECEVLGNVWQHPELMKEGNE